MKATNSSSSSQGRKLVTLFAALLAPLSVACSSPRQFQGIDAGAAGFGGGSGGGGGGSAGSGAAGGSVGSGGLVAPGTGGGAGHSDVGGGAAGAGIAGASGGQAGSTPTTGSGGAMAASGGDGGGPIAGSGGAGGGVNPGTGGGGNVPGTGGVGTGGTNSGGAATGGKGTGGAASGGAAGSPATGGKGGAGGAGGAAAPTCTPACAAPTGGTTKCVSTNVCMPTCNTVGQSICNNACVEKTTDKNNCGVCGTTCEGYQYCGAGKCVPHYEWTRTMPTSLSAPFPTVMGAGVAQSGDIILEVLIGSQTLTFSLPQESTRSITAPASTTTLALARISSANNLQWAFDFSSVLGTLTQPINPLTATPLALTSNSDIMIGYLKSDAPPMASSHYRLGRVSGANPTLQWESEYLQSGPWTILPRSARGDFITVGNFISFSSPVVASIVEGEPIATALSGVFGAGASLGADGTTVWFWGAQNSNLALQLNPWSQTVWHVPTDSDVFIIGAKDNGLQVGPWFTATNNGGYLGQASTLFSDQQGNVIFNAVATGNSSGSVTLNGKEILSRTSPAGLSKINSTTGDVIWKRDVPFFDAFGISPDGSIVAAAFGTNTYSINVFSDVDGSTLVAFSGSGQATTLATGAGSLVIIGGVSVASDFNPGTGTDAQGGLPGLFISRFSY